MALPHCLAYNFTGGLPETNFWHEGEWYADCYTKAQVLCLRFLLLIELRS